MNMPPMNKKALLSQLQRQIQEEVNATLGAVKEAHALASHEQSKPENQYDTLALEAAYLAHGQSERIVELQKQIIALNHFELKDFTSENPIALGALVCLDEVKSTQWLWLLPVAGGALLETRDITLRTITAQAPLAKKLIGQYVGEEIELVMGNESKQFEIIDLL